MFLDYEFGYYFFEPTQVNEQIDSNILLSHNKFDTFLLRNMESHICNYYLTQDDPPFMRITWPVRYP